MIIIKQGVDVRDLHPIMWNLIYDIEPFYEEEGLDFVITAALDGVHMDFSKHYSGVGIDIRTRTLNDPREMFVRIKSVIHPAFDVVLHSTHMHIEYDPKNQDERISGITQTLRKT